MNMPSNQFNPGKPAGQVDFQDPLENYDPKSYKDALERALAEETVMEIRNQPVITVAPDCRIAEAIALMASQQLGCLLVEEDNYLVGVFTDRDVLNKVVFEYEQVKDRPIRDFMNTDPVFVYETDCAAAALSVMAVSGFRHVPVTNIDKKVVGIVTPKRVTTFLRKYADT